MRGHFAYYGVGGNSRRLHWFANQVVRVWRKWLSRRDRQGVVTWARLNELLARHPLRESLWLRLLVALHRSGRRAEALERYQAIRVRLADELGVDPGSELRRVYADLLADRVPAVTCWGCPLRGRSIVAAR